jgi:hypothetical protein
VSSTGVPNEENKKIPQEFLVQGQKMNVIADRHIGVLGDNNWTAFEYYKTFKENPSGDNNDISDSVGLVLNYYRDTQYLSIEGLSFGFTYRYDCKLRFPDFMN